MDLAIEQFDAKPIGRIVFGFAEEFVTLGFHLAERRHIIAWKVPKGGIGAGSILRIPFLKMADETIEDTDTYLLPILHQIMLDGAEQYGMRIPKMKLPRAIQSDS